MRLALLLCVLILAGCPRMSNETVPMPRAPRTKNTPMAPTSRTQLKPKVDTTAALDIPPPIAWLELGTGFTAAPIPEEVASEFATGNTSRDKSRLQTTAKETVWLQAFTSKGSEREIGNYYKSLLTVKEFQEVEPAGSAPPGVSRKPRKALRTWRSLDKRFEVHVYDSGAAQAAAKPETEAEPIYIVEVHDARPSGASGGTGP